MAITLDFLTGAIGWSSSTAAPTDLATFNFVDDTDFLFVDGSGFDFIG